MKKKWNDIYGTGLLECLVVLLILSLCAVLACGILVEFDRIALLRAAQHFSSMLEKNIQLAYQRECDLELNLTDSGYTLECSENILESYTYPKGVNVRAKSSGRQLTKLFQDGVANPATFIVSRKRDECQVVLSLRGRVRSECERG